ncbi:MAG: hypothetical protein IT432_11695 [Phycisphaerales bacterium]|nr:hypothetical protein [Phycisphaerales bacterium]
MGDDTKLSPARCWLTYAGLILLGGAAAGFLATYGVQRLTTGSFARGEGFVIGWLTFPLVLYGLPLALLALLVGGFVDSRRYSRWKKSQSQSAG